MNPSSEPSDTPAASGSVPGAPDARQARAIDRRRLLLKGVGRGSALLGATVPLKTLAGTRVITFDATQCTVSGMQSGVHSASPSNLTCKGYTPSSWGQSVNNAGLVPVKAWPTGVNPGAACTTVLINCKLTVLSKPATLFQIVNQFPTSDDAHWLCAWLNAQVPTTANLNFPYSTDSVLRFYSSSSSNALAFFKKYTETGA